MTGAARVAGLALVWALVTSAAALLPGCFGRNCEGTVEYFGRNPGEGALVNADTWESSPVGTRWLNFPRQRVWDFELRELGDREPRTIVPYVSASPNPAESGDNFVIGAGNLVELSGARKGHVTVKNGTCADYYLRLVVVAAPLPKSPSGDGGGPPVSDASSDAPDAADAGP